jgi:hypothetical protein
VTPRQQLIGEHGVAGRAAVAARGCMGEGSVARHEKLRSSSGRSGAANGGAWGGRYRDGPVGIPMATINDLHGRAAV